MMALANERVPIYTVQRGEGGDKRLANRNVSAQLPDQTEFGRRLSRPTHRLRSSRRGNRLSEFALSALEAVGKDAVGKHEIGAAIENSIGTVERVVKLSDYKFARPLEIDCSAKVSALPHRSPDIALTIAELQTSGAQSLQAIADGLNNRNIATATGSSWSALQVIQIMACLALSGSQQR
jgi:hypothetical protein